jgi:hypothetical protein
MTDSGASHTMADENVFGKMRPALCPVIPPFHLAAHSLAEKFRYLLVINQRIRRRCCPKLFELMRSRGRVWDRWLTL